MARIVLISDDDGLRQDMRSLVTKRGHSMLEQPARAVCHVNCLREPLDAAFVDLSAVGDYGLAMIVRTRLHMPGTRIAVIDGGRGCDSLDRGPRSLSSLEPPAFSSEVRPPRAGPGIINNVIIPQ